MSLARQRLQGSLGREPTLEEIITETGLTSEEIVTATEADYQVESIYTPMYQKDGNEVLLMDTLGQEDKEKEALLNHM